MLTVEGEDLRASAGVVRAALFSILGPAVIGCRLVDLFAGAGSLGIEGLSRGAEQATFVELRRERAALITANCEMLGYADRGEVVLADAVGWVRRFPVRLLGCSLVLLDPPYAAPGPEAGLRALEELGLLAAREQGWDPVVVLEHHRQQPVPEWAGALNCVRTARYGTTLLSFYRRPR